MKKLNTLRFLLPILTLLVTSKSMTAQNLPDEWHTSSDGKRLLTGGTPTTGFYDEATIHTIELWFDEANYWTLLANNYASGTDLGALMIVDGDTLASEVGVRFKGQTSYMQNLNSQKKSFNITLDFADPGQDIDGYETLNLNNCFQDPSFLREVLYLHLSRNHTPSLKGNFVQLYINGQYWGPYPSVQGLDSDFLKEWFLSNDGTRWRALKTISSGGPGGPGGPGGTGGPFGTGYSSLNWLGTADTSEYKKYYTLKKAHKSNPWEDLVRTCDKLNNTPLNALEDTIRHYLDLDRTLWYLATEIAFADDDGYVWKGGMDYYLYWEPETGRLVPLEYDGNSAMEMQNATWSPFINANDIRFPLLNRLMAVPAIRQRYLAHLRTIIGDDLDQATANSLIDNYVEMIDPLVATDTKKIYTYAEFQTEKNVLKNFIQQRRDFLLSNAEIIQQGPVISSVEMSSSGGAWTAPAAGETANVTAQISSTNGISKINLYCAGGLVGTFEKTEMFDDGAHNDGAAGDGVFGGTIPGFGNGSYVRFYVEALSDNSAKTAVYMPKGAEHDVFFYHVGVTEYIDSEVVINEIMASNTAAIADQDGQFDDWIELYNNSGTAIDLSGWHLTDDFTNLPKWTFPTGTIIGGNGYLIVWADENGSQAGLHANFKLSASGEELYLLDPEMRIAQTVIYGQQQTDLGYARVPNGTGDFVVQTQTFNGHNENFTPAEEVTPETTFQLFPNPSDQLVFIQALDAPGMEITVFNPIGQQWLKQDFSGEKTVDVSGWTPGVYFVKIGQHVRKLVVE